jgi:hypothetical protein
MSAKRGRGEEGDKNPFDSFAYTPSGAEDTTDSVSLQVSLELSWGSMA